MNPVISRRRAPYSPQNQTGSATATKTTGRAQPKVVSFLQHSTTKHRAAGISAAKVYLLPHNEGVVGLPSLQVAMEISMLKYIIIGVTSLAFVGTAVAADLPRPQPVAQSAPVGKYPVGKFPVGKAPLGKAPVVAAKY